MLQTDIPATSNQNLFTIPSIVDFDELFTVTPNKTVFNELMINRSSEEIINILCDISNDKTDTVATCECGYLMGNYYEGILCRKCNTVAKNDLFGEIRNDSWLEVPHPIHAVLNPQAFRVLSKWIGSVKKIPILNSIIDMQGGSNPIPDTPFFSGMGFNWLYENFDTFMGFFLANHPSKSKRATAKEIEMFLAVSGRAIWCTKLPILSKLIQPITRKSNTVRYADADIRFLIKAIFSIKSILLAEKLMKFSADHVDRNFYTVYNEFLNYYSNILTEKLPRKPSILRKHVFGSRFHCTCRSVATPITDPHNSDEVYFPWKLGVVVFKYHILSVLVNKRGMSVLNAFNRIMTAINVYDHELDLIMQGLIHDCPFAGLPILLNRNPSLQIGSIQLMFVTKIKPALKSSQYSELIGANSVNNNQPNCILVDDESDSELGASYDFFTHCEPDVPNQNAQLIRYVEDGAIAVSPTIVKGPNLDFDGDECNILPIFEMNEVAKFDRLRPYHRTISSEKLGMEGGDVMLSNQQFCILSSWLNDPEY